MQRIARVRQRYLFFAVMSTAGTTEVIRSTLVTVLFCIARAVVSGYENCGDLDIRGVHGNGNPHSHGIPMGIGVVLGYKWEWEWE